MSERKTAMLGMYGLLIISILATITIKMWQGGSVQLIGPIIVSLFIIFYHITGITPKARNKSMKQL